MEQMSAVRYVTCILDGITYHSHVFVGPIVEDFAFTRFRMVVVSDCGSKFHYATMAVRGSETKRARSERWNLLRFLLTDTASHWISIHDMTDEREMAHLIERLWPGQQSAYFRIGVDKAIVSRSSFQTWGQMAREMSAAAEKTAAESKTNASPSRRCT
jgi:hypothetical protein